MLKRRLSSIVQRRGGSRRNERASSAGSACNQQQHSARAAPSAQSQNMFCSSPTQTRQTNDAGGGMQHPRVRNEIGDNCDDDGVPPSSPPNYEDFFGSKDREETDGSNSPYSENQNANNSASESGVVTIFKIRPDALPEKVEGFLAATKFLAYRIDGVLSLSIDARSPTGGPHQE